MKNSPFATKCLLLGLLAVLLSTMHSRQNIAAASAPEQGPHTTRPTLTPEPTAGTQRPTLCERRPPGSAAPAGCLKQSAEILLRLSTNSGSAIPPGQVAIYQLTAHNSGRGDTTGVHIMLAFAPDIQQLLDATFSDAGAWVSAVLTETIVLRFDRLMSNQTISATLRLRISPAAPFGRDLTTRAQARWGGGTSFSNRARLVVGEASDATALAPLAIAPPSGTPATTVDVIYDGFASNESVSLWYHLPDSSAVGLGTVRADAQGCIVYRLTATTLGAGRYNVVAYGQYSRISATGTVVLAAQLGGL